MVDKLTPNARSENMRLIRSQDTGPELAVRRYLYAAGLRYRLHRRDLPGRPDLVFKSRRICVFVHGCFWHGCRRCVDGTRSVKSNSAYWIEKIRGNKDRDARNQALLEADGWQVLTVWECETRNVKALGSLAQTISAAVVQQPRAQTGRHAARSSGRLRA